jgi:hypothetical protein
MQQANEELSPDYNFVNRSIGITIYSHIPGLNFLFFLFAFIHGILQVRNYALFNRVIPKFLKSSWITIKLTTVRIIYAAILNLILIPLNLNPFGWMISKYVYLFPRFNDFIIRITGPYYVDSATNDIAWYHIYISVLFIIAFTFYFYSILGSLFGIIYYKIQLKTRFNEINKKEKEEHSVITGEAIV